MSKRWKPDQNGWIDCRGQPCPVEPSVLVEVLLDRERCDHEYKKVVAPAKEWPWGEKVAGVEVVADRVARR